MSGRPITLKRVSVHNLKAVDLTLEPHQLIVFTGVSGSGKSSLAFDTLFIEGQRRYVESLSTFARRHLGEMPKPALEEASGLSPPIAIEQKTAGRNPRSTVGTITEIYDYLRVLFARLATPYCPVSGEPVVALGRESIITTIQRQYVGAEITLLAPIAKGQKGEFKDEFQNLKKRGFLHVRVDGALVALDEEISLDRLVTHDIEVVVDRLLATPDAASRIAGAVQTALEMGSGLCLVVTKEQEKLFSTHAYSPASGLAYRALEPQDFSFNHPAGMCPACMGLGVTEEFDLTKIIDPEKSIAEDCCRIASSYQTVLYGNIYDNLARLFDFSVYTPWVDLPESARQVFLYGAGNKRLRMRFVHPTKGSSWTDYMEWRGVVHEAKRRLGEAKSEGYVQHVRKLMHSQQCLSCKGTRLAPYPAAARLSDKGLADLCQMSLSECAAFFCNLSLTPHQQLIAEELVKEISQRLQFLIDVGLHYLTLSRTAPTLSGGEAQRVRLAAQVGCGLVGVTYVLDEPSIGLHPRDNKRLLKTLTELRDRGNTVVVVEHDEETIWQADRVIDFGPGAGQEGGRIVVDGTVQDLIESQESLTGAYLSGRKQIAIPMNRREVKGSLWLLGASHHNLKDVDLEVPLGVLVALTGVSGSGKSSLIIDTLYPALANQLHRADMSVGHYRQLEGLSQIDKVIAIDQSPIGRNPRSNPATYVKVLDDIRDLFAQLPASLARGFAKGRFSFNVAEGSCAECGGMGQKRIDMDFMEDAWVTCTVCQGQRFDSETLDIRYKGKNISEILEMTIREAYAFFELVPPIAQKLKTLLNVGLGYLRLGQPSPSLSGGEAQRVKLAKELCRPTTGRTFYILDEPTTGLHFHDIAELLKVLQALVDRGNTVLVIEHNMDVVKTADWIVDLGPEGGDAGGEIVASGRPEEIALLPTPTGEAVSAALSNRQSMASKGERSSTTPPLECISVQGASQNNLKDVSTLIPRGKITVCTGPSGSGKSSLAFETLYAEGQRRYIESLSPYARQFVRQMAKPKVRAVDGLLPAIAIEQKSHAGNPRSTVGTLTESYDYLRVLYARLGTPHCPETGEVIRSISKEFVAERLLELPQDELFTVLAPLEPPKTGFQEFISRLKSKGFMRIRLNGEYHLLEEEIPYRPKRRNQLELVVDQLSVATGRTRLNEALETAIKIGGGRLTIARVHEDLQYNLSFSVEKTGKSYPPITPHTFSFNRPEGMCPDCYGLGLEGIEVSEEEEEEEEVVYLQRPVCSSCNGERLTPLARRVTLRSGILELSIGQLCRLPVTDALIFLEALTLKGENEKILGEIYQQLLSKLRFLKTVGLGYLSLERSAPTLSNGEAARIRLARQLGSSLTGVLYVLDEPTVGLHPRDSERLNAALLSLKELGNTIVMVEHDPLTVATADHIIDFGPGAGRHGGCITAQGSLEEIKKNPESKTGAFLSGRRIVSLPKERRTSDCSLSLFQVRQNNLKSISVDFPISAFSCVTGPSGAGKSTLITDFLVAAATEGINSGEDTVTLAGGSVSGVSAFDRLIVLDQNPIGRTARSDVGTYVDIFSYLRTLYAQHPKSMIHGLTSSHFSPNHRKGMCSSCRGMGYCLIDLQFMPPLQVDCEECRGKRLTSLSLEIEYSGVSFGKLFSLTVQEARELFSHHRRIARTLDTLLSVGLGYLTLGQEVATLSGGEAQRLKLSRELSKRASKKTLYILDEPTTGLHFEEIDQLAAVLQKLVDKGATIIAIEHNLDFIKQADYVVDLGPVAGEGGGYLLAKGTPEEVAASITSVTGPYLSSLLSEKARCLA